MVCFLILTPIAVLFLNKISSTGHERLILPPKSKTNFLNESIYEYIPPFI